MRKYYYYAASSATSTFSGVNYSETGEFEIFETLSWLAKKYNKEYVITFWQEISETQHEKMRKYFDNQGK